MTTSREPCARNADDPCAPCKQGGPCAYRLMLGPKERYELARLERIMERAPRDERAPLIDEKFDDTLPWEGPEGDG